MTAASKQSGEHSDQDALDGPMPLDEPEPGAPETPMWLPLLGGALLLLGLLALVVSRSAGAGAGGSEAPAAGASGAPPSVASAE